MSALPVTSACSPRRHPLTGFAEIELDEDGWPVNLVVDLSYPDHKPGDRQEAAVAAFAEVFPGFYLNPAAWWPEGPSPWRSAGPVLRGLVRAEVRPGCHPTLWAWQRRTMDEPHGLLRLVFPSE
jgi:hypothetical protein